MTSISNMDLPDDVVERTAKGMCDDELWAGAWIIASVSERNIWIHRAKAAIRAALQAMVDTGMAHFITTWRGQAIAIRLDNADERKRKDKP